MTPGDALRHLVTWGLVGGPTEPVVLGDSRGLAAMAEYHQVTGVVLSAIEAGAAMGVDEALVEDLAERHRRLLHRTLAAEADLVAVARRLRASDVEFRVLKGCATAHLDHDDPGCRLTSDVDLLVRNDELGRVTDVVSALVDTASTVPDRRRRWTEQYGKDRTLRLRSGGELDVHRLLAPGFHGLVDDHDWFANPEPFTVAGTELLAPPACDRLAHAIAHAGYADEVRHHSIRDVPVLLGNVGDGWVDAVGQHPRWRGLLARGVAVVWGQLGLGPHPLREWAQQVRPDRSERVALRSFDLPGSRQHWGAVAAVGPWRWPGLLLPIALPSDDYLAHHDRTPAGHVGATVTKLRRARLRRPPTSDR